MKTGIMERVGVVAIETNDRFFQKKQAFSINLDISNRDCALVLDVSNVSS